MLPKLQYYLTNWADGMKISRQHFVDSENALIDGLRDVTATTLPPFSYGLLQPFPGEKNALECTIQSNQSKQFKITVSQCRAITSGGCRIEIIPGIHPELVSDSETFAALDGLSTGKGPAGAYLAVISVDPFTRQPFGNAAADEYPPRNAHSISACRLSLVAEEELNASSIGAYNVPVARFMMKSGELVKDNNYIPPCAVIAAHQGTKQIYNTIAERLNQIQEYSMSIIQKVMDGGQNTPLAQNLKKACEQSVWHISSEFFFFRMMYRQQSPVFMANTVVNLANAINISLNVIAGKEKEELLQYFSFWNEVSPGKFEELLAAVINCDYEHESIALSFEPLLTFLKVWGDLLEKLKDLKLIGQKNEKFDFGGRTMETPKEKGKGKFSIFD